MGERREFLQAQLTKLLTIEACILSGHRVTFEDAKAIADTIEYTQRGEIISLFYKGRALWYNPNSSLHTTRKET